MLPVCDMVGCTKRRWGALGGSRGALGGGGGELVQENCSRASKDSEKALDLDLIVTGHLKEGSSRQCGRSIVSQEVETVCMEPSFLCKFGIEGKVKSLNYC